jgi:hypothetical protein
VTVFEQLKLARERADAVWLPCALAATTDVASTANARTKTFLI